MKNPPACCLAFYAAQVHVWSRWEFFMFSVKNAAYVAIMQVWVIVMGVLASGLWYNFSPSSNMQMPFPAALLYDYGIGGFLIPLTWIACALTIRNRSEISDDVKRLAFWFGVLVLVALAVFVVYANVSPFFHIMWRLNVDGER